MLKIKKGFARDSVCGMVIPEKENATVFQSLHFAFCSTQCKERFLDHPYLYIGTPGRKSAKQEGVEIFKNRRIKLENLISGEDAQAVVDVIQAMMGIKDVRIEGSHISLCYDLLQVTEEQIESEIEALGVKLGNGWAERVRRAFVHFFEDNECSAMSVRSDSGKSCH